jgi:farnesyl-diphosphate farnesyltransferase
MDVIKQVKNEHRTSRAGLDRASMRRCWELIDKTAKTFVAVFRDLEGDIARVVSISTCHQRSHGILYRMRTLAQLW